MVSEGMKNIFTRFFGHRKYKQFVVICHPRTGSNLLLSYLGTHPNIKVQGEIFKRLNGETIKEVYNSFMRKRPGPIKASGFKVFYSHPEDGDHEQLLDLIDTIPDPLIIHLTREDKFRTLVSWKISLKTDIWGLHTTQELLPSSQKSITIDPGEAQAFAKTLSEDEKRIHQRFRQKKYIHLTYEQLQSSPSDSLEKICSALSLSYVPMQTRYRKSNPEPLEILVSNYQDLIAKGIIDQINQASSSFE
jgi:LPS sulfotransferase NodH